MGTCSVRPKICCICGKSFYPAVMHIYKKIWNRKTYYACKPSCFNKMLEFIEESKDMKARGETVNKLIDKNGPDVL